MMKKLLLGLTTLALTASMMTGTMAKPDKGKWKDNDRRENHGSRVSSKARDKDDGRYRNHGKKVSRVASSKSKGNYKRHHKRRYRTKRHYNSKTRRYESRRVWSYYDPNRRRWIRE